MKKNTCIVILGPTAVGKTSLAIQLAKLYRTEIVSADSRQCFRELNIGVAKPSTEQLKEVHHYFINSHSINEEVTAASFETYALGSVNKIFLEHDIAVMVGGTGLYIKAFCEGMDIIPDIDAAIRNNVIGSYNEKGIDWLKEQIKQHDPIFFEQGEMDNPQRMMRALEVVLATGQSIRQHQRGNKAVRDFNIIKIGLELPRDILYQQINHRVDLMMQEGLLNEVKELYPYKNLNALQTVGYSELYDFIDGKTNLENAIEKIKTNTRNYAKRQITWFKKAGVDAFFSPSNFEGIKEFVVRSLQQL